MSLIQKSKLGLGAVQFGLDYGIANKDGQVSVTMAKAIMRTANDHALNVIDTASAYGNSETVLGKCFQETYKNKFSVFTKTKPLRLSEIRKENVDEVSLCFDESLRKLQLSGVAGILVHHAEDLLLSGSDRLYAKLQEWKSEGRVGKIGVSVYDAREIDQLFSRYEFDVVQLPLNVFDQRLVSDGSLRKLSNKGVELHARSLLLQGVLLLEPEQLPMHLRKLRSPLKKLHSIAADRGISPLSVALGFAKFTEEVSVALVGVTSVDHLHECISSYSNAQQIDFSEFAVTDIELLDPRQWPKIKR